MEGGNCCPPSSAWIKKKKTVNTVDCSLFPVSCQYSQLFFLYNHNHFLTINMYLLLSQWQQSSPNLNGTVIFTKTTMFPLTQLSVYLNLSSRLTKSCLCLNLSKPQQYRRHSIKQPNFQQWFQKLFKQQKNPVIQSIL